MFRRANLLLAFKVLAIAVILVVFSSCEVDERISKAEKLTKLESELSQTNINTFNYCFYIKDSAKLLTLYFSADVSVFDINKAELFSGEDVVSDKIEILSIELNKINVKIDEYIENFDTIRLYDNNNDYICLYAGQYYFELLSPDKASSSTLPDFSVVDHGKTLDIDLTVEQYGNNTYEFIIPKLMSNFSSSENIYGNKKESIYNLKQRIALTDAIDSMSGLSFELALVEKTLGNNECILAIAQVPISRSEQH